MDLPREPSPPDREPPPPDPYFAVVITLCALAAFGVAAIGTAGLSLVNIAVLDAAVSLLIAAGSLARVAMARRPPPAATERPRGAAPASPAAAAAVVTAPADAPSLPTPPARRRTSVDWRSLPETVRALVRWRPKQSVNVAAFTGATAAIVTFFLHYAALEATLATRPAIFAAVVCVAGGGLSVVAARYLAHIHTDAFDDAPALARGARVLTWILAAAALAIGLQWAGWHAGVTAVSLAIGGINTIAALELLTRPDVDVTSEPTFRLRIVDALGRRWNIVAGLLDSAERHLGIDLRSTWALTVIRRGAEPLALGVILAGWLLTGVTAIAVQEEGIVERFGVPRPGVLSPGLHLHFPWPIERVARVPVQVVQRIGVGHEGEEEGGQEDVLWARQHADQEYTLLLGNGRDLITVDAAVQFRIVDAFKWRYQAANPVDALRAVAYRAVMRNTVSKTLTDALSENVVTTTALMRDMVQADADALGLGVSILGFTVGGMHPPVAVATDYQSVVSAELRKTTAAVEAQAYRQRMVPAATGATIVDRNMAVAEGALARARAIGESSAFQALQAGYRIAPQDFVFRRTLEELERTLTGQRYTILDYRIQRDGGELWLIP